jgi:hypothetical protein
VAQKKSTKQSSKKTKEPIKRKKKV